MLGTQLCDRCWELERRIKSDPQIAARILASVSQPDLGHLDIVFDGPPGPEAGRFVEVEDGTGKSIQFGEWIKREDGLWALRFTPGGAA